MTEDPLIKLRETIIAVHGKTGAVWWDNLPEQLEAISKKHGLMLLSPFQGLSYNYVQPVIGPHQEAWVLKCSVHHDELAQELLLSQGEPVLLHGDLHHYNLLQHQDTWLAIDPKGVVGEREFEIGAFLRNPVCVVEDPMEWASSWACCCDS